MTDRTSKVRGDVWFEAGATTYKGNSAAPLCEELFKGAFNCAEIAVAQSTFFESFGPDAKLTKFDAIESDASSKWPGVSTADLIRECLRMGGDLMLNHDGFLGDPYHGAKSGNPWFAPFPGNGLGYYGAVARWLARTHKPRFYVVLNEPFFSENGAVPITPAEYLEILLRVVPIVRRHSPQTTIIADGHPLWMAESSLESVVAEWHDWTFEDGHRIPFIPLPHDSPEQVRFALRRTIGGMRRRYPRHEHFLGEIALSRDAGEELIYAMLSTLQELKMGYCNLVIGGMPRAVLDQFALVDHGSNRLSAYSPAGIGWIAAAKRLGQWQEQPKEPEEIMNEEETRSVLAKLERAEEREPTLRAIKRGGRATRKQERGARREVGCAIDLLEERLSAGEESE